MTRPHPESTEISMLDKYARAHKINPEDAENLVETHYSRLEGGGAGLKTVGINRPTKAEALKKIGRTITAHNNYHDGVLMYLATIDTLTNDSDNVALANVDIKVSLTTARANLKEEIGKLIESNDKLPKELRGDAREHWPVMPK